ncbi:hypothetical protein SAMN05444377_11185 [Flavobacterium fontis]|uniref:Uncharacterized protein n=1 Tax=Flavobacterium fontis TaxID=1124188 RepID=A0A1M5CDM6_9FLAO|nr:hypothetical protein [Flavobacterium fontis]SHF52848.1 hypothetical protein SAMN05444377_11185 [Flavobacterium fontis]
MDKQSIFFSILAVIIATIILFVGLSYYTRSRKMQIVDEMQLNKSYLIWLLGIILPFFVYCGASVQASETTIETIIHAKEINDTFFQILYRLVIYFGLAIVLAVSSNYLIFKLFGIIIGGRSLIVELENSNTSLFLVLMLINLFFSFSIINPFKDLLNWYLPQIATNFIY